MIYLPSARRTSAQTTRAPAVPPTVQTVALVALDSAVRASLGQLGSSSLADESWAQAQLALKVCGLGLRQAERRALRLPSLPRGLLCALGSFGRAYPTTTLAPTAL